jgi:protocatechuate 3,4-dioxygenase beta subunit
MISRAALCILWLGGPAFAADPGANPVPGPDCSECSHLEAPADLGHSVVIAGTSEPGERLVLEGRVLQPDGRNPAPSVLLYAYHTNARGIYPKRGDEQGMARWHGDLRGWLRTATDGRYRIETIRPGPYPDGGIPAHIHMTVTPPDGRERWIDDVVFDDDPFVTAFYRRGARGPGGSGIVHAERDEAGVWRASRDIVLPD